MESAQHVSGCVTELLCKQPFFGSLALKLPLRADTSRETLASNGHEIRYSPQWVTDTDAHFIVRLEPASMVLRAARRRGKTSSEDTLSTGLGENFTSTGYHPSQGWGDNHKLSTETSNLVPLLIIAPQCLSDLAHHTVIVGENLNVSRKAARATRAVTTRPLTFQAQRHQLRKSVS